MVRNKWLQTYWKFFELFFANKILKAFFVERLLSSIMKFEIHFEKQEQKIHFAQISHV